MSGSVLPLRRDVAAGDVAETLRERLLSGRVAPGARLDDGELSERLGTSPGAVRSALAELARDGLVVHRGSGDVEAARLGREDLSDIYAARRVMERAGLEALLAGSPPDVSWLSAAVERMGEAAVARDGRAAVEADLAFHLALVACAGSRRLTLSAEAALMDLRLALSVADRAADDLPALVADHQHLAAVFATGRRRRSLAALDEHLERGEALVRAVTPA